MEDEKILELFFLRKEEAIQETEKNYGPDLRRIAKNILGTREEAEEVVSDVFYRTWTRIPPEKPRLFAAWLKKLTRSAAIDRYRSLNRLKRGGGEYELSLSEIEDMASGKDSPEEMLSAKELGRLISNWLKTLSHQKQELFLGRYFYAASLRELACQQNISEGTLKVQLLRLRTDLKNYLAKEGYHL